MTGRNGAKYPLALICAYSAQNGVGVDFTFIEAFELDLARLIDAFTNDVGTFTGVFTRQLLIAQARHFDLNIDAIE